MRASANAQRPILLREMRKFSVLAICTVVVAAAVFVVAACAEVLGIEDGVPRESDAAVDRSVSPPDSSARAVPLACGASSCLAAGESCCRSSLDAGPDATSASFRCLSDAAACSGQADVLYPCDRTAGCAVGRVCCAYSSGRTGSKCVALSECAGDGGGTVLCAPDSSTECAPDSGLTCKPSTVTALGFYVCKN